MLFVVSLLRMGYERVINSTAEHNQIQPRDIKYRCCILIGTEASCVYPFPVTSVGGNRRGYLLTAGLGLMSFTVSGLPFQKFRAMSSH